MGKLEALDICMEYFQARTGNSMLAIDRLNLVVEDGSFVSLVGVTTRTRTNRSPRPAPLRLGMPLPRMRNTASVCVPSGIFSVS